MHSNTFAARAGRWSAKHRKKAIWGWLAFVAIAFVIGGALGVKKPANQNDYIGQSGKADRLIDNHFPKQEDETVLVQAAKGGKATDPAVRKAVDDVIAGVSRQPGVAEVKSPYANGNEGQLSKDGRSVLVEFKVRGNDDQTSKRIDPVIESVVKAKAANPNVFVGQFGGASANKALSKSFSDDFKKAEFLSLPITLIILILAFGALVAAGVPLLLGLTAVMATLGLVAIPSQFVPMDDTVSSVVLLVGLAVGVDYTLFYLRREREEKARGASKIDAVHTAAATSGRAVLVSGFTVMVAMAGMFFAGGRTFTALGVGAIMVVAVAMIGSVTVVPAVLAWLGDRIEKGRVPFLHGRRNSSGESRAWDWILTKVLKHPVISAVASASILIVLALPAFGMHTVLTGHRRPAAQARGHEGLRPRAGRLPRRADPGRGGHRGQGRDHAADPGGREEDGRPRLRHAVDERPAERRRQRRQARRVDLGPDARRRHRPVVGQRAVRSARRDRRPDRRRGPGGQERVRDRHRRGHEGLQRPRQGPRADRVRLRAVAGLPAAAGDLPLDRHPDQGDRAEPAVGRRRLRRS